jgi:hypothetical protein
MIGVDVVDELEADDVTYCLDVAVDIIGVLLANGS